MKKKKDILLALQLIYKGCSEHNIIFYWPTTSKVDVGGIAVEVKPSQQ